MGNDALISIADWYATFCSLAGVADVTDQRAKTAGLPPLDSYDMSSVLLRKSKTNPRSDIVLSAFSGGTAPEQGLVGGPRYFGKGEGVVEGPDSEGRFWKLIVGTQLPGPFGTTSTVQCSDGNKSGWGPGNTGVACTCGTAGCLYELTTDETESHDVSNSYPDVLQKLQAKLSLARATVYAPPRGDPDPAACAANVC